jgi:hypothetical protein
VFQVDGVVMRIELLSHRKEATTGEFSGSGDCGGASVECCVVPAIWLEK